MANPKSDRLLSIVIRFVAASTVLFAAPGGGHAAASSWQVVASQIDPTHYYGVTLANGVIGIVSSAEPLHAKQVVINGVYDDYGRGRVSNLLEGFDHVSMKLEIDGEAIGRKDVSDYRQTLDMREAVLVTDFVAAKLSIRHEIMALRQLPYSALINVTLTNGPEPVEVTPMAVIEAPDHLRSVLNYFAQIDRPHAQIPLMTSVAESPSGRLSIAATSSLVFPLPRDQWPDLIHEDWDHGMHFVKFRKRLAPGEVFRFSLVATTCATGQCSDPRNEAERLTVFAALEGPERLAARHREAWQTLWDTGNVYVEGDRDAEREIRFALYHLYSFARAGTASSLSPMGLSGLGYNGHVFWDAELWMIPPLLILQPEIARSALEYRFARLDAAKRNAFAHGYAGAMFPWESAEDGSEATPVWALTGPFQQHITACVAWAHWKYFQVTGDVDWLKQRGWPVLAAAADFWASRVARMGPGQFSIENVIGANEWQENVDDNAFTNGMAITTLRYATQAAQTLGYEPNPDWNYVAENISIPSFPDGTTRENRGYDGVAIKQADVNLLAYPIEFIVDPAQVRRDLGYYAKRMSPLGPAMGNAILSILYNQVGETRESARLFAASYKPNQVPPFGVLAETAGGTNPYFATGAGGMLQAVLAGFGGLRIRDAGIVQIPSTLPPGWKSLRIVGVGKDDVEIVVGN